MRRLIMAFCLTILFGFLGFFTTGLGLAVFSPFHAGSIAFPVQETAIQGLVWILPEPLDRIDILTEQVQLRIADLKDCSESNCTQQAVNSLNRSFTGILKEVIRLDDQTSQLQRTRLADLFGNLQQALQKTETDRAQVDAFLARLSATMAILNDPSRSLSSLLDFAEVEQQSPRMFVPTLLVLPTVQPRHVSVRMVLFPPGSVGAMHAFFPLNGKHQGLECRACHPDGLYAGTPTACRACHAGNAPQNHFPGECDLCHKTEGWLPASFSHQAFDTSDCSTCHLVNRPANHYSGQCSACHSTTAWKPATFNHQAAGATDCGSCHANKPPANHYSGQCSACHSTTAWKPATFNHQAAGATDCGSCHVNKRPANHYSGQCSACHSTTAWKPATFNHQAAGATDCAGCHANKRPANHYNGQCSACHSTSAWTPATFNHQAMGATDCANCHANKRPANHFSGQCSACHSTSGWTPATFNHQAAGATDCAGCHSGRKPANHFAGQCSDCHNTDTWKGASFNHSFPLDHGNANSQCSTCHPGGGSSWTCFGCHNQGEMDKKHNEKGIPNYATRCLECHPGGRGGD